MNLCVLNANRADRGGRKGSRLCRKQIGHPQIICPKEVDWTSTNYLPQNHPRFHPIPLVLIETQNTKKHCQYGSLKLDMS
jgi:hypothetical protein